MTHSTAREAIRAAGLRATAARVAVLDLLRSRGRALPHADVAAAFAARGWDRATLYRNLMDLAEAGLLRRVCLGSIWHFEAADLGVHPHFVCTECGGVECTPQVRVPIRSAGRAPGAVRRGEVDVQLHGRCDRCR